MSTLHSIIEKFEGWDFDLSSTGRFEAKFPNMHMASIAIAEITHNWGDRLVSIHNDTVNNATVLVVGRFQI